MAKKMFTILTTALISFLSTIGLAQAKDNIELTSHAFADVNKDGRKNLVVTTNQGLGGFLNQGPIMYAEATGNGFGELKEFKLQDGNAAVVTAGDANNDGYYDIAILSRNKPGARTLKIAYGPDFSQWHEIATGPLEDVAIGDIEGDGYNDLSFVLNPNADERDDARVQTDTRIAYKKGQGDGSFGPMQNLNIDNPDAHSITVCDMDGDGDGDVVTGDANSLYENDKKDFDTITKISYNENKGNLQFDESKEIMRIKEWFTDIQVEPEVCKEKPHLTYLWRKDFRVKLGGASAEESVCKLNSKVNETVERFRKTENKPLVIQDKYKTKVIQDIYSK